jgi:photosystem II stability/assembly factor-like uncharacterized protein
MSFATHANTSPSTRIKGLDVNDPAVTTVPKLKKWQHRALRYESLRVTPSGEFEAEPLVAAQKKRFDEVVAYRKSAAAKSGTAKAAGISRSSWSLVGPGNVPGRARGIAVDPTDPNIVYVAAATGGVWKTTDGGNNWTPYGDAMESMVMNTIAIDPNNRNILYASSGEWSTGFFGRGVFRSEDAGVTWAPVAAHAGNWTGWHNNNDTLWSGRGTHRLSLHPSISGNMLVSTNYGIYRSTNGGTSYARVWPESVNFTNFFLANSVPTVTFNPLNGNEAVAATFDGRILGSRDGGQTWATAQMQPRTANNVRTEVQFAPSVPGKLYALYGPGAGRLYVSTDYGATWAQVSELPLGVNQGFDQYKNMLWVSPTNDRHLLAGALNLYQSLDGGATWSLYMNTTGGLDTAIHVDIHLIATQRGYGSGGNNRLWVATDGGIYALADSTTPMTGTAVQANGWRHMNGGMTTSQAYHISADTTRGRIGMGTQDNGVVWYREGDAERAWIKPRTGGDVFRIFVDPASNYAFYVYQFLEVARLVNDGTGSPVFERICDGLFDTYNDAAGQCGAFRAGASTPRANFGAPMSFDAVGDGRLLAGGRELWRSTNPRAARVTWASIKAPLANGSLIAAIGTTNTASSVDHVWVGHNNGEVYRTTNATAPTPAWSLLGGLPTRSATSFFIEPSNPSNVLVTLSGTAQTTSNLWATSDGGTSWRQLGSNLPRVAFLSVTRHPTNRNWIYVGTDLGIYTSEDDGATWSAVNDGPANVMVHSLTWYGNNVLLAGTHGRGVWKATITQTPGGGDRPLDYSDMWWAGQSESGWGMSIQQHASNVQFNAIYAYDAQGQPRWYVMPGGTWNANFTVYSGLLYQPTGAPLNSYNPASLAVGAPSGNATLTFTSAGSATLAYTINGVSGQKSITRQAFGSGTAPLQVADLWWGGTSQNGWGINIAQQAGTLFSVWYTYGGDGRAQWYVMPGGSWNGTTYSGPFFATSGPQWLGVSFNPAQVAVQQMGTMSFNFSDANNAVMTYTFTAGPFAGTSQSKPIVRQAF